jgi:glycosyltransferase involved in cell wall biosynthesis
MIPSHNPNPDYLGETIEYLKNQTLPRAQWELLLIDNGSDRPLSTVFDLTWHPNARHIREDELGVMVARCRGIRESRGALLVNVDDDNLLAPGYLETALRLGVEHPKLGVWGGRIDPRFEAEPPEWTRPWWNLLAIRQIERDNWSNLYYQDLTTPPGAGMCIRREVAEAYRINTQKDPRRLKLCRRGKGVISAGDCDLAYTACDIGFGTGLFTALRLTHLIARNRLTEEYLLRLVEGINYSTVMLRALRGEVPEPPSASLSFRLRELKLLLSMDARARRFYHAAKRGSASAHRDLDALPHA